MHAHLLLAGAHQLARQSMQRKRGDEIRGGGGPAIVNPGPFPKQADDPWGLNAQRTKLRYRKGSLAFGEARALWADHKPDVREARRRQPERAVELNLASGGGEEICAAQDVGDPAERIVDHDRQLIARDPVVSADDEITHPRVHVLDTAPLDLVDKLGGTRIRAKTCRRHSLECALAYLLGAERAAGAGIARAIVGGAVRS